MERKIRIEQHSGLGLFWFAGWLFTIGYLGTGFWRGLLALIVWPYYLGVKFAAPVQSAILPLFSMAA